MNVPRKAYGGVLIIAALAVAGLTIPAGAAVTATSVPGTMGAIGDHMGTMGDHGTMGNQMSTMGSMGDHTAMVGPGGVACGSTGTGDGSPPTP